MRRRRRNCADMWFKQDGATAHTANESMTTVRNMFPGHPHFPFRRLCRGLLAVPIFQRVIFFGGVGGYLKSRVYAHKPRTSNDLKETIRPIDRQLLSSVMDDFITRLGNCVQEDGRHLTYLLNSWCRVLLTDIICKT